MMSGGGDGRRYLPVANAPAAISAKTSAGRAEAIVPSRCAQASQNLPRTRARQPLRAIRSPHSTQKFADDIAGVPARARALYFTGGYRIISLTTFCPDTKVNPSFLRDCNNNDFFFSFIQIPPRPNRTEVHNETQNLSDNRCYCNPVKMTD